MSEAGKPAADGESKFIHFMTFPNTESLPHQPNFLQHIFGNMKSSEGLTESSGRTKQQGISIKKSLNLEDLRSYDQEKLQKNKSKESGTLSEVKSNDLIKKPSAGAQLSDSIIPMGLNKRSQKQLEKELVNGPLNFSKLTNVSSALKALDGSKQDQAKKQHKVHKP